LEVAVVVNATFFQKLKPKFIANFESNSNQAVNWLNQRISHVSIAEMIADRIPSYTRINPSVVMGVNQYMKS